MHLRQLAPAGLLLAIAAVPATAQDRAELVGEKSPAYRAGELAEQLASPLASERAAAATELAELYPEGAAAAPALLVVVDDKDEDVRSAAHRAISRLAAGGLGDIATYLEELGTNDRDRAQWLTLCQDLAGRGPAVTPRDLALVLVGEPGVKPDADGLARMRAVPVLCAAGATGTGKQIVLQSLALARSAARSTEPGIRRNGLAALAVLGRATLVERRCAGDPIEIAPADDAAHVTRLLALLPPEKTTDERLRRTLEDHVVMLLGASYGHAGEAFLKELETRATAIATTTSRSRLDVAALGPDSRSAAEYLQMFRAPIASVRAKAVCAMNVRREASTKLLSDIREFLESKDADVRLTAALLVLQLSPGDADAGPVAFEEFGNLLARPAKGREASERTSMLEFASKWIRRMPEPPAGVAEKLFIVMPRSGDDAAAALVAHAMVPSLAKNGQLQRYLRRNVFPDEGEVRRPIEDVRTRDALAEGLALGGEASAPQIAEWVQMLTSDQTADPAQQIAMIGPAWNATRPAHLMHLVSSNGARAKSALPAIEPYLMSTDLLLRFRARQAVDRIRAK